MLKAHFWILILALGLTGACAPAPPLELPTLAALPTLRPTTSPSAQRALPVVTVERLAEPVITLTAPPVLVITPTPPPSKTPTATDTPSATPTFTASPTIPTTATATATALIPPTRVVPLITAVVAQPVERVCDSQWFFIQPRPAACPLAEPTASMAVFQQFERGLMIWLERDDIIYVLYNSFDYPAWELHPDTYDDTMPEVDGDWEPPPYDYTFQPRRGFGTLWRANVGIRERLGWAVYKWEVPYSTTLQTGDDGAVYLQDPDGGVIMLGAGQRDWSRYMGGAVAVGGE